MASSMVFIKLLAEPEGIREGGGVMCAYSEVAAHGRGSEGAERVPLLCGGGAI
jgi:hypothetical protein